MLPLKLRNDILFYRFYKRKINRITPKMLDEKLLLLSERQKDDSLIKNNTDKVKVRDYVEHRCGSDVLIPLIGVYNCVEDVPWEILPKEFVIKCNHGSGMNIVVTNKYDFNEEDASIQLSEWMNIDYALIYGECHYRNIERKILIEEFIGGKSLPTDYKFFCSRGQIICCLIIYERSMVDGSFQRVYLDQHGNDLEFLPHDVPLDEVIPPNYTELVQMASILSKDYPFVRVDLYSVSGKAFFGELTFSPHGCVHPFLSEDTQMWIGSKIQDGLA